MPRRGYFANVALNNYIYYKKETTQRMVMADATICKERILSEDYCDFIIDDIRTSFLAGLNMDTVCQQYAGYDYKCIYLSRLQAEPITMERFSYSSIPKCYAPLSIETLNQTGILPIQNYPTLQLKGNGILIGFLDGGIDYQNPIFRNLDGSTRIVGIWDQTIQEGLPPNDFAYGTEYTQDMINEALRSEAPLNVLPSVDETGHGTFVAGLAAGSGNAAEAFLGAAPEASIAVVKLKPAKQYLRDYYFIPDDIACYQETDIILGLRYLDLLAERLGLPLVYCIALGTNAGGHVGVLPLPDLLNSYGNITNHIPVIGGGNEADKRHHYFNDILDDTDTKNVEVRVGENVSGFTMELWTSLPNILSIAITSPSGQSTARLPIRANASTDFSFLFEKTRVLIEYRLIGEKETSELIFFRFTAPTPGIWTIQVEPVHVLDGSFHIWLPISEFLGGEVYFLTSNPYYTITNPGNALSPMTVSYYDGSTNAIALSSGRGYGRNEHITPDLTAPGINVKSSLPGGRYAVRSGSSIAAGVTSGCMALLLEWIIYQLGYPGIDASQAKGMLILGATRPSDMEFPNREWGYGQLNLFNTFEAIRQL